MGSSLGRYSRIRLDNAGLAVLARRHRAGPVTAVPFLCECDDEGCESSIELALADYDRVRDRGLFITASGHAIAVGCPVISNREYTAHAVD